MRDSEHNEELTKGSVSPEYHLSEIRNCFLTKRLRWEEFQVKSALCFSCLRVQGRQYYE
jgi:hypothetical protein